MSSFHNIRLCEFDPAASARIISARLHDMNGTTTIHAEGVMIARRTVEIIDCGYRHGQSLTRALVENKYAHGHLRWEWINLRDSVDDLNQAFYLAGLRLPPVRERLRDIMAAIFLNKP